MTRLSTDEIINDARRTAAALPAVGMVDANVVGALLDLTARTARRKGHIGEIPRPTRVGGALRWSCAELHAFAAGRWKPAESTK